MPEFCCRVDYEDGRSTSYVFYLNDAGFIKNTAIPNDYWASIDTALYTIGTLGQGELSMRYNKWISLGHRWLTSKGLSTHESVVRHLLHGKCTLQQLRELQAKGYA